MLQQVLKKNFLNAIKSVKMEANQYNITKRGELLVGVVTNLEKDRKTIWVVRQEKVKTEVQAMREAFDEVGPSLKKILIPDIHELFILNWEGVYLRAYRMLHEEEPFNEDWILIFFQDTGETISLSHREAFKHDFFEMPEKLKQFPSLAIKCTWSGNIVNTNNPDVPDDEFFYSLWYKTLLIEAVEVEPENVINIWPMNNFSVDHGYDYTFKVQSEQEPPIDDGWNDNPDIDGYRDYSDEDTEVLVGDVDLAEWEIEETAFTTTNASVAIHGYETKDDKEFCKFYNPHTGCCFKGANCKKIHLPQLEDGYETRDKHEISFNIPSALLLPPFFKSFKIKITHFNTLNQFMCVYENNISKIMELEEQMNSPGEVDHYIRLINTPCYLQLVTFKDINGKFLRARILDISDNQSKYLILLLDWGLQTEGTINQLYEWCTRFQDTDFFGIEMNIANIAPIEGKIKEATTEIYNIQRENEYLKAYVVGYFNSIECLLLNSNEKDISECLSAKGLVTIKEADSVSSLRAINIIPG